MKNLIYLSILFISFFYFSSCEKTPVEANSSQLLVIENGAVSAEPNQSISYKAFLIDLNGNKTAVSNVSWTSSNTSIASVNTSGQVTISAVGITTITATVTIGGVTLSTQAPLSVMVPTIFAVAPSVLLVDTDFPDMTLNSIYLGTGSPAYGYQSSNNSVATVSSTGVVHFVAAGSCEITVTANGLDGTPTFIVPVLVLGAPTLTLPVSRIVMTPSSNSILKTETAQFSAKAYNFNNQEVSTTLTWSVADPTIATVSASGLVTPLKVGSTEILVTASGITSKAELDVSPDKVIIINPSYATVPAGQTKQFTANQYQVIRSGGQLVLGSMMTANNLNWEIPTYGFSVFDIATINSSGLATVKSSAAPGLITYVIASDPSNTEIEQGIAILSVAIASNCNCGNQNSAAASMSLTSPTNITLSLGQTAQIQAQVLDSNGSPVSAATLVYCSDNLQIADVDNNGEISATGFGTGTATITVCHGSLSRTITVSLQ